VIIDDERHYGATGRRGRRAEGAMVDGWMLMLEDVGSRLVRMEVGDFL
jgi:hypothetical protein